MKKWRETLVIPISDRPITVKTSGRIIVVQIGTHVNVEGAIVCIEAVTATDPKSFEPTFFRCSHCTGDKFVLASHRRRQDEHYTYEDDYILPAEKVATALLQMQRKQEQC